MRPTISLLGKILPSVCRLQPKGRPVSIESSVCTRTGDQGNGRVLKLGEGIVGSSCVQSTLSREDSVGKPRHLFQYPRSSDTKNTFWLDHASGDRWNDVVIALLVRVWLEGYGGMKKGEGGYSMSVRTCLNYVVNEKSS